MASHAAFSGVQARHEVPLSPEKSFLDLCPLSHQFATEDVTLRGRARSQRRCNPSEPRRGVQVAWLEELMKALSSEQELVNRIELEGDMLEADYLTRVLKELYPTM